MTTNNAQQFNALNGAEMVEFVTKKIREAMENSGEFPVALTWPLFRLTFSVKIENFTGAQVENGKAILDVPQSTLSVKGGQEPTEATEGRTVATVSVDSILVVDTPDKARIESGQPIPVVAPGPKGILVDRPTVVRPPVKGGK